jgi:hypothetical protein
MRTARRASHSERDTERRPSTSRLEGKARGVLDVYVHTAGNAPVPVPLTEVKPGQAL